MVVVNIGGAVSGRLGFFGRWRTWGSRPNCIWRRIEW